MPVITEGAHDGEFLIREANGDRSREQITVLEDEVLVPGTVLGKITASGKYVQHDPDAVDGSEDVAGILFGSVDASDGDVQAVAIVRDATVLLSSLTWLSSDTDVLGVPALALLGIIGR